MSRFEEVIRLVLETAGAENVDALVESFGDLGDISEEARAKMEALVEAMTKAQDSADLAKTYRETGAALRDLDKAHREQLAAVQELAAAEKDGAAALGEKRAALDAAKATLQAYEDGTHGVTDSTKDIAEAHQAAKDDVAALTAEVKAATREQANDAAALERSRAALTKTADQRQRTLELVRSYSQQLKAAGVDVTRLAAEEERLAKEVAQAADQLGILAEVTRENAVVARDTAQATDQAAASQLSLGEAATKARTALAAAAAAIYGVQRALTAAASDSSEFATAMAKINMQLDDSSHLDAISDGLRRLAREYGGDLIDNATALYETMSRGGEDWAESLELLQHANKLAIAESEDLVDTAKLVRASMAAYRMEMDAAEKVADQLSYTIGIGNLTLGELAATLPRVASLAATAGVSFEELTTGIGTLTTGGMPAAEAGTALVGMLQAIVKPTEQAAKLAKELGLEFNTSALASKGLAGFLEDVMKKTGGTDRSIATLFGSVTGLNGVLQLAGSLAEQFESDLDGLGTAAGRAAANFDKFSDTPAQKMALYQAAMKDLRVTLGGVVTAFTPMLEILTGAVELFNELPGPVRTGTAALAALTGVIGSAAVAARALGPALKSLGLALPAVGAGAESSAKSVSRLGVALKGLGVVMVAGWSLEKVAEAIVALKGLAEVNRDLADAERELRAARGQQALQIDRLKEKYGELAEAQIRNSDLLRELSESDLSAYVKELDGAAKYWRAIEIEAKNAGDVQTQAFARERADEFAAALAKGRDRLVEIRDALDGVGTAAEQAFAKVHAELFNAGTTAERLTKHLDEAFKDRDFRGTTEELGQMAVAMAQIGSYAGESDKVIREGLLDSLNKLSGRDLLAFRDAAKVAFAEAGDAAGNAAAVMETVITSAMTQLGISAQAAGRQITAEGENVIALFKVVAESGTASANQVEMAFRNALARVSTTAEAEALGEALKRAGEQGAIGAQAAERAMSALQRRVEELRRAASPLADAFSELGIKSQAELNQAAEAARAAFDAIVQGAKEGEAAQEDVARAFLVWAEAARAASADSNEYTRNQVEALIRSRAAALGLRDALEEAGDAGQRMGDKVATGAGVAAAALGKATDALKDNTDKTSQATSATKELSSAYGSVASSANTAGVAIRGLGGEFVPWTRTVAGWAQVVFSVGQGQKEMAESAAAAREELRGLNDELARAQLEQNGDQEQLAKLDHQAAMARIEELAKAAGNAGISEAAEARKRQEALHRERMAQIRAEGEARTEAAQAGAGQIGGGQASPAPHRPAPVRVELEVTSKAAAGAQEVTLSNMQLSELVGRVVGELKREMDRSQ